MKKLLAVLTAILLTFSPIVNAVAPAKSEAFINGITVTLYETPCSSPEMVATIKPEYLKAFQDGTVTFVKGITGFPEDIVASMCWTVDPELLELVGLKTGELLYIDSLGYAGSLELRLFTEATKTRIQGTHSF